MDDGASNVESNVDNWTCRYAPDPTAWVHLHLHSLSHDSVGYTSRYDSLTPGEPGKCVYCGGHVRVKLGDQVPGVILIEANGTVF